MRSSAAGRLARLSLAGLRLAAASDIAEPAGLARWLYRFGIAPRGSPLERNLGPDDDPMAVLGLATGGAARRVLAEHYEATSFPGWFSFARSESSTSMTPTCKLYVSPRVDALGDAFPEIVAAFERAHVRSFKVGRGIYGLLRPDKIVAYFDDVRRLTDVAHAIEGRLQGCPVQGVPFTAEVAGDGLVSAGVDPPFVHELSSWRAWVTTTLAAALVEAKALRSCDAVGAALAAIKRAGVDPETWSPTVAWLGEVAAS